MDVPPLTELSSLALADTDGPWLMPDGVFALKISLRGKEGGMMPSSSEIRWRPELPDCMRTEPFRVFLRRGSTAVYLGMASLERPRRVRLAEPLPEDAWRAFVAAATAPPPPSPAGALTEITKASTAEACIAALGVFLDRWHGPQATVAAENAAAYAISPPILQRFYALARGRSFFAHNRMVGLKDLRDKDGKMVFYIENQGCCTWAIDAGASEDPPVWVRTNDAGAAWERECDRLSLFVLQAAIFEHTMAPPFSASTEALSPRALAKLTKLVPPFAAPAWQSSGTRFYAGSDLIGFANPSDNVFEVYLAGHTRDPFEAIESLIAGWPNVAI